MIIDSTRTIFKTESKWTTLADISPSVGFTCNFEDSTHKNQLLNQHINFYNEKGDRNKVWNRKL